MLKGSGADGVGPTLQSLERGLLVLIELSRQPELGVSRLGSLIGVNKSTVYRILSTLRRYGFVEQNPLNGKYALSIRAFEVGAAVANRFGLLEQASPQMELLAATFNETVNLAVLDQADIIYLHKIESSEPLRLGLRVGTRVPAHASALGKALLAAMDDGELRRWFRDYAPHGRLATYTPKTIGSPEALLRDLELVRSRGFSFDDEEYKQGIRCVAAVVRDHLGRAVAAVSVAAPSIRLTATRVMEEVGPTVARAARKISTSLGYGAYPSAGLTPPDSSWRALTARTTPVTEPREGRR